MDATVPVTVLMPVYNGERYLGEAVESILNQTFYDYEFLIIDDGSTDRTAEILLSFHDERIRLVRNNTNLRLIATLNHGVEIARGKYIARMDCDDISHPERLEKQFQFMEVHPEIGVLGTGIQVINAVGKTGCKYTFPAEHEVIRWSLSFYCPLAHPSVMVRREVILRSGGYYQHMRHVEDYDLWRRLSAKTRLSNLTEALLYLRKHGSNITQVAESEHQRNLLLVANEAIKEILGEDVDERVIECIRLRSCDSVETAIVAAKIIKEMYEKYTNMNRSDDEIGNAIRRDAGLRILLIGLVSSCDRRILAMAMRLDKWALFSVASKAIRSLVCQWSTRGVES